MSNPMTVPALRRFMAEHGGTLIVENYREVGRFKIAKFDNLRLSIALAPNVHHDIELGTAVVYHAVRQNFSEVKPRPNFSDHELVMLPSWTKWKPSSITLLDEDVDTLESLAMNGSRLQRWEPDWRLFGAGIINLELDKRPKDGDLFFHVRISNHGVWALDAAIGKTLDDMRNERREQAEAAKREAAQRHIRMSPRYGEGCVDFSVPALPTLLVTYNIQSKRYFFTGSVSREDTGHHIHNTLLGKFLRGVDFLIGYAESGERYYYDLNTDRAIKEG